MIDSTEITINSNDSNDCTISTNNISIINTSHSIMSSNISYNINSTNGVTISSNIISSNNIGVNNNTKVISINMIGVNNIRVNINPAFQIEMFLQRSNCCESWGS